MHGKIIAVAALAACTAAARSNASGDPGNATASANVNSRYTVESVAVAPIGWSRVSAPLRERLEKFVGGRLDQSQLDEAVTRLGRELRSRAVTTQIAKGASPDSVAVTFHVEMQDRGFDVDVSQLLYHSKRNFSFGANVTYRSEGHRIFAGSQTGNDELVERASGVRGGYERSLAGGRVRVGAEAGAWRSQWNGATEAAVPDSLYRTRVDFQPSAAIEFLKPLTLQLGVSVGRLELNTPAVRHELSSAVFGTLRFQRRWGLDSGIRERFEAAYGIRAGTPGLASDYSFVRHHAMARFGLKKGHEEVLATFQAGLLNGRAPLYERFVGGNSRTLRGWNRFDLAPYGADRLAHLSFDYRWRKLRLAYDAGSVWLRSGEAPLRHSAAIGIGDNLWSGLSLLVAFPLREGRVEPVFIAGMNF